MSKIFPQCFKLSAYGYSYYPTELDKNQVVKHCGGVRVGG